VVLVKIGGGASINLDGIAADIASIDGPMVVVHGANAARDRLAAGLGLRKRVVTSVSGYDSVYSDEAAIDLLMMAYAGLQNKRIVERLQRHGRNALGLTGLDGRAVSGTRNKGIRAREGEKTLLLRDYSGKPSTVNAPLLRLLLDHGYTPVLTVPLVDEQGFAINSENDEVVALLQGVLQASHVIELIEAPGLLRDPVDPASVVPALDVGDLARLEARAEGRFKRKLLALCRLFESSSPTVVIADGRGAHPVAAAMAGEGTTITAARRTASGGPAFEGAR
jgi:acetylglutamate/LysW-gamma-L-alpha-aminoadipate kinase